MPNLQHCLFALLATIVALSLGACASRPINPKLEVADRKAGYRVETRAIRGEAGDTMVVLAFSGGGTRAAAFSFGVLEELRRTQITVDGRRTRMLDEIDVITGVSGGSFTALAYALHGEKLFDDYEKRFLKRDVQGALVSRFLSPFNWPALASDSWGRSEAAAQYYDEILFDGATYGDLIGRDGPVAVASATDISTGSRFSFTQADWDMICSDLSRVRLSRAAAASSAVPVVLSAVTVNNYGGTCAYEDPFWTRAVADPSNRARPAGRAMQRYREMQGYQDGANRPYLHLVDGGLADNLGTRAVLETLETVEASRALGRRTRLDKLRRIVVFVVNSLSTPRTDWDRSERPPSSVQLLLKATGVPIDRYSYESVELLKDLISRWHTLRALRTGSAASVASDAFFDRATNVPDLELYAIDVSFSAHPDPAERAYLNDLPTSFVLADEEVDRLRVAAGTVIRNSSEFQRLLQALEQPAATSDVAPAASR